MLIPRGSNYHLIFSGNCPDACLSAVSSTPYVGSHQMIHQATVSFITDCAKRCCPGECQSFYYTVNGTCQIFDGINPRENLDIDQGKFYILV